MATRPDPNPTPAPDAPAPDAPAPVVTFLVTSSLAVLGKSAGAVIPVSVLEAAGCNIPALVAAGHLTEQE